MTGGQEPEAVRPCRRPNRRELRELREELPEACLIKTGVMVCTCHVL